MGLLQAVSRPGHFRFPSQHTSRRSWYKSHRCPAADTVIFYDHDWNPSNHSRAMERARRLDQTRQVTVYRLITKGTIDDESCSWHE